MQSFMPIHFVFKIRTIENGFADPKRFRDFRETGPWRHMWVAFVVGSRPWGAFLEGPEKFSVRKAITKILNLMFTQLFFSHNFNTNKV